METLTTAATVMIVSSIIYFIITIFFLMRAFEAFRFIKETKDSNDLIAQRLDKIIDLIKTNLKVDL